MKADVQNCNSEIRLANWSDPGLVDTLNVRIMRQEVFHDEEEKELMNQYGFTSEAKTVFHF